MPLTSRRKRPWLLPDLLTPKGRRTFAYGTGLVIATSLLGVFVSVPEGRILAKGPANPGHSELDCADCHENAPGTLRQQLQGVVAYGLARRPDLPTVGRLPVSNETCLDCHVRPQDRHPVYRFFEPQFIDARREIGANQCRSCHREHSGRHVSNAGNFCVACHEDIRLKREKIDPSHEQLSADGRWDTCLSCHDFHGNHEWETPDSLARALPLEEVQRYLKDGESVYGSKTVRARSD